MIEKVVIDEIYADELPSKVGIDRLDRNRFRKFFENYYDENLPESNDKLVNLLKNLNLMSDNSKLNLTGLLLFAENPEQIKPQFILKAIRYPGNEIHTDKYSDIEDISGNLYDIYSGAKSFIMRNLKRYQFDSNINSPGKTEIPENVFVELLVNSLVHRDYLIDAPIRLFIFDNRIEIVTPGNLPNNLTVEKIIKGTTLCRNPNILSFVAKGILPYKGLGSGIIRALKLWPFIDFIDDREGSLFTVKVHRKSEKEAQKFTNSTNISQNSSPKGSPKHKPGSPKSSPKNSLSHLNGTAKKIINMITIDSQITIREIAVEIGISERAVKKHIKKFKDNGIIHRHGSARKGYWEVTSFEIPPFTRPSGPPVGR